MQRLKLLPSYKTHRNQQKNVIEPYLPMQDKSVPSTLSLHYGRKQLIPLVWNQDLFSWKANNELLCSLAYATKVFENLVIVHQFHSDNGRWVGRSYQDSLSKCLLICHVEMFKVINQEWSPINGELFIVSCTNFMSCYGNFSG